MTSYVGNDSSSYQMGNGFSYLPYVDNGPFAQSGQKVGEVTGAAVLGVVGGKLGGSAGSVVGQIVGTFAGASAGERAGFYIDNLSAITKNANTFFEEVNSPRSWMQNYSL